MALMLVCLPCLLVELWGEAVIQSILYLVDDLSIIDECIVERRWLGFACANLRIYLSRLLRPSIQVKGPKGIFWQRFVYESFDGVCFNCGRFYHAEAVWTVGRGDEHSDLDLENLVQEGEKEDRVAKGCGSLPYASGNRWSWGGR